MQRRIEADHRRRCSDQENLVEAFKSGNARAAKLTELSAGHLLGPTSARRRQPRRGHSRDRRGGKRAAWLHAGATGRCCGRPRRPASVGSSGCRRARMSEQIVDALAKPRTSGCRVLPQIDDLVARVQAAPIRERARDLQDMYLDLYGRAAARAGTFRILLYAGAVVLVAYVGYLFLRLRANARSLQERLDLEKMIAEISTQFINLPRTRINEEIQDGLRARRPAHGGGTRADRRPGRRAVPDRRHSHLAASRDPRAGLSARRRAFD